MKRLLLAIALLLGLADVAAAQNVTCATRPVTDNSNACANTAFVNSYVNNPASPIYSTAHTWLATQTFSPSSGLAMIAKSPSTATPTPIADTATLAKFYVGSSGTPVTSTAPSFSISRYDTSHITAGVYPSALFVETIGQNTSSAHGVAPLNAATFRATQNGDGDVLGVGVEVTGNGGNSYYAYGYFYNVWAKVAAQASFGIEGIITNDSASAPYSAGATNVYFAHFNVASAGTFDVTAGLHFWQGIWGTKQDVGVLGGVGSIRSALIWDDSSGVTSYKDTGTHTDGIDLTQATYSGSAIKSTGFTLSNIGGITADTVLVKSILALDHANADVELGSTSASGTPFIDFHSSGNNIDYDARIIASGGTGVAGNGTLSVVAAAFAIPGTTIGSPSGGNQGAGTLNVQSAIYNNGTAPTGTGAYVRASNPTLVAPVLGAATAASVTTPVVYGGAAANSVLYLSSTSNGAPSGDAVAIQAHEVVLEGAPSGAVNVYVGRATNSQGTLYFGGSTSGYIGIGVANAASGFWTLPNATDQFVGRATTDTLTNKTLGATTLSGTISGGGNQINNVIIGASTPLAGSFTTLSASTSITSPLHIGGSGTTGTQLTFQTTTGTGTTDGFAWVRGTAGGTLAMTLNDMGLHIGAGVNSSAVAGDITLGRSGTTGVMYFGSSGGQYVYYDGSKYNVVGGAIALANATYLMRNTVSWTNNAAAATGTLTNAPAAGNPTKWIAIDDNGTTRYIPAW